MALPVLQRGGIRPTSSATAGSGESASTTIFELEGTPADPCSWHPQGPPGDLAEVDLFEVLVDVAGARSKA